MTTQQPTLDCICKRRGHAHDHTIARPLVVDDEVFAVWNFQLNPATAYQALRQQHILAEENLRSMFRILKQVVFTAGVRPRYARWAELLAKFVALQQPFERTVIRDRIADRVEELRTRVAWQEPAKRDMDDYIQIVRIFFTAARELYETIPLDRSLGGTDVYLTFIAACTERIDAGKDVANVDGHIVQDGVSFPFAEAMSRAETALDVCRWAVCALDRVVPGAVRYLRRLGRELKAGRRQERIENGEPDSDGESTCQGAQCRGCEDCDAFDLNADELELPRHESDGSGEETEEEEQEGDDEEERTDDEGYAEY